MAITSWFRSWHGAPTDNKWLVIARKANVAPGIVSAVAWALLDYASQAEDRGSVKGFDVETYAVFSGFDEGDIASVIAAMHDKNVIDQNERLTEWMKWQLAETLRPSTKVWAELRAYVFERDNYTCQYCGRRGVKLECDHVIPVSRGGGNDLSNLATACRDCNRSKQAKTVEEWLT